MKSTTYNYYVLDSYSRRKCNGFIMSYVMFFLSLNTFNHGNKRHLIFLKLSDDVEVQVF